MRMFVLAHGKLIVRIFDVLGSTAGLLRAAGEGSVVAPSVVMDA